MSYTDLIRVTNSLCQFSRDGSRFASSFQNKLIIRNARTFDICDAFACIGIIQFIRWSPDNQLILCALYHHNTVQVFSLQKPDWKCKLRDTVYGIVGVHWSPDSRHILTVAEFHVSICIWSLVSHSVKYIECAKGIANPSLSFSADGEYLAVVGDRGSWDCISVYSVTSWELKRQIDCVGLDRLGGITWTPDCAAVCAWTGAPDKFQVKVYEASTGDVVGSCQLPSSDMLIGIKTVAWVPSGQFLVLGSHDDKVWFLNHITWQPMIELPHSDVISDADCIVYQEFSGRGQLNKIVFKVISGRPVIISSLRIDPEKPTNSTGIGLVVFSSCGHFLATQASKMPSVIWIWSVGSLKLLSVIIHRQSVSAIAWDPVEPRLAIVSGSSFVSLWCNQVVKAQTVDDMCISDVRWHPKGHCLALCANSKIAFLPVTV